MTASAGEIDWDAAVRPERRRELIGLALVSAYFVGIVLLTGGVGPVTGGAAWVLVGLVLALVLASVAAGQVVPRLRRNGTDALRMQTALRRHLDPGPELRTRTDRQARYWAAVTWPGWVSPLLPVSFLMDGRWDRPAAAAVGAVLVVGTVAAWMLYWRTGVRAARRWLADPPGPARQLPPATRLERWLSSGRRLAVLAGVVLALAVVTGLVSALVSRA